jgi:hypothetical protein
MTPVVTEEQLKSLKLFSYYLQSHGIKKAEMQVYIEDCTIGYMPDNAYGDGGHAELYDAIRETLENIVESNELHSIGDDCDNRGSLNFFINCVERTLEAEYDEYVHGTNEMSDSKYIDDDDLDGDEKDAIEGFLSEISKTGDKVYFNGGGDSGEIDSKTDNGVEVPTDVLNFLYSWLENFYGGWEINEGSQGSFDFDPSERAVFLNFGENTEETVSAGIDFQIKF